MYCEGAGIDENELYPVYREALDLDEKAVRLARSRGAIDLAIGGTLLRLFRGDRLHELGFSKRADYARERLGVPARTMFGWVRLARGLADRPLLRRAVVAGAVTPRKALAIFPVALGPDEGPWTAAAMSSTLRALEERMRAAGHEPPAEPEFESLWLKMRAREQDRLDAAVALAREQIGFGAPRWQCVEAICQEWLGTFGSWVVPEGAPPDVSHEEKGDETEALQCHLRSLEEARFVVEENAGPDDAHALDARVQRLLRARRGFDEVFGPLALRIVRSRVREVLGYRSLDEYCRERLSMSPRSVRPRAWLERQMCTLPALREALASGRLTYSKALLVAKDATPFDVVERIEHAAATTWQQTERESTEKEDRQNCAAGVRRLWGPKDAAPTLWDAIASAQAWAEERGAALDTGGALALIAQYFMAVHAAHEKRPRMSRKRREVLLRHGGLCAVPGCSRPAEHVHHVVFRSRGGSNDKTNEVGVCVPHHLRGIHQGYLAVAGCAGERLVWELGTSRSGPLEVWVTEGDDCVWRATG